MPYDTEPNWKYDGGGLGDLTALERKVALIRKDEATREIATGILSLAGELRYLDGCVKRGRGIPIDHERPGRNVFEYIKELEGKIAQVKRVASGEDQVADDDTGGMAWIADYLAPNFLRS